MLFLNQKLIDIIFMLVLLVHASRALIYRELKELQNHISVDIVHPDMLEDDGNLTYLFQVQLKIQFTTMNFCVKFIRKQIQKSPQALLFPSCGTNTLKLLSIMSPLKSLGS